MLSGKNSKLGSVISTVQLAKLYMPSQLSLQSLKSASMSYQQLSLSHPLLSLMLKSARLSSVVCLSITLTAGLAAPTHAAAVTAVARAEATRLRESITTIE